MLFLPGATEAVMLLALLGGGVGIPLGVPPGPEDPVLARIAPEKCLYYTRWAGMAVPDANSPNHTEQMLADPQLRALVAEAERRIRQAIQTAAAEDQEGAIAAAIFPDLIKTLITHPTAIFVEDFQVGPTGPAIKGAVVVKLGEQAAKVKPALDRMLRQLLRNQAQETQIGGTTFHQVQPAPQAPVFTWGIKNNYFVLGIGDGAVEEVFERADTPAPGWLTTAEGNIPVERRSTFTYANLKTMTNLGAGLLGNPQFQTMLDAKTLTPWATHPPARPGAVRKKQELVSHANLPKNFPPCCTSSGAF